MDSNHITSYSEFQHQNQGIGIVPLIIILAVAVLYVASMWKVFAKAGKPGWAAIVPIYNIIVMLEVAGKPLWWIVLYILPVVSIIPAFMVPIGIANNFGKGAGFGVGMALLGPIFWPILGFGSAQYVGPGGMQGGMAGGLPQARAY